MFKNVMEFLIRNNTVINGSLIETNLELNQILLKDVLIYKNGSCVYAEYYTLNMGDIKEILK